MSSCSTKIGLTQELSVVLGEIWSHNNTYSRIPSSRWLERKHKCKFSPSWNICKELELQKKASLLQSLMMCLCSLPHHLNWGTLFQLCSVPNEVIVSSRIFCWNVVVLLFVFCQEKLLVLWKLRIHHFCNYRQRLLGKTLVLLAFDRLIIEFINYLVFRDDCVFLHRVHLSYLKIRHAADRCFRKVIHLILK